MVKTLKLFQFVLIACFGVYECSSDSPWLQLFRSHDYDSSDKNIVLHGSVSDLSTLDFDDQTHSVHWHAVVILYEHKDYNAAYPGADHDWLKWVVKGQYYAGRRNVLTKLSSVRFVGSYQDENHIPSITLYQDINWGGVREEQITRSKPELEHSDYKSLFGFGNSNWTFYDEVNYGGKGHCVLSSSDPEGALPLRNSDEIGFSLSGKRSVEKGCWAFHGVAAN